jgi:hypothetical protein
MTAVQNTARRRADTAAPLLPKGFIAISPERALPPLQRGAAVRGRRVRSGRRVRFTNEDASNYPVPLT